MYHDAVNPPAAARFYAYAMLTGYEILSQLDPSVSSFQKTLRDYPMIKVIVPSLINKELAVLYGILETGRSIIPSGYLLEEKQKQLVATYVNKNLSMPVIDSSIVFAKAISKLIVEYARSDGYFKLSTKTRYTPLASNGSWKPTPPEYMAAVEPHWRTIRTFFLDSVQQFRPATACPFNEAGLLRLYETHEGSVYNRNATD